MLPSRGLPRVRLAPFARGQAINVRSIASRRFSSAPRNAALWAPSRPSCPPCARLNSSTVRHASWYAPWTWGRSSTPSTPAADTSVAASPPSEATPTIAHEPAVTTATPELAAGGIDKAAVVEDTNPSQPTHQSVESLVEDVLQSDEASSAADVVPLIEKYGALKELGLDFGYGPTSTFEWLIEHIYLDTGIGWGASILAATVIIRLVLFRFQIMASDNMAKIASISPLVKDLGEQMKESINEGDDAKTRVMRTKQARIYKEVRASPVKGVFPMVLQGVFGFAAFRCLRNMSALPVPGMSNEGFLWFPDLTIGDPYYVLPALSGLTMYLVVKAGGETGASTQAMQESVKFLMQKVFPIGMSLITCFQPASIQIYLCCTAVLSGVTATMLRNPGFRRRLKLTPLPTPEANEMWTKVAKGEIPLDKVMTKDGQFISFAPTQTQPIYQGPGQAGSKHQNRGLNIKVGASVPLHLQTKSHSASMVGIDRDHDFDSPPKGFLKKVDWAGRNYKPKFVYRRFKLRLVKTVGSKDVQRRIEKKKKEIAMKKTEEYEFRRRQRLGQQ